MKIYTRRGDEGETDLFAGGRVPKDDARVAAYGEVDELNAALGLARAALPEGDLTHVLARVQAELFTVGAELATPDPSRTARPEQIAAADVAALEADIDRLDALNAPLHQFVLPAGTPGAAALHLARCVCRRAERAVVALARRERSAGGELRPELLIYLNRLGDLLFVMARAANRQAGVPDQPWTPRSRR